MTSRPRPQPVVGAVLQVRSLNVIDNWASHIAVLFGLGGTKDGKDNDTAVNFACMRHGRCEINGDVRRLAS